MSVPVLIPNLLPPPQLMFSGPPKLNPNVELVNVTGVTPQEAADAIVGSGGVRRPDACIDCCGFESSVNTALAAAKSGGRVCLVGMVSRRKN